MLGNSKDHIVLVHGLWMRGFTLITLRRRLERAGFSVDTFDYASVFRNPAISVDKLRQSTRVSRSKKIHFVGHSLGGLMVLQALLKEPDLAKGHVVCLGSPLRGSSVARKLATFPGGSLLLGRSMNMLRTGLEFWGGVQKVGSIAGRMPLGLGSAIGGLKKPHDGMVSVEETQLRGLTDHCVVRTTHAGLPFSKEVARQTIAFLTDAHFVHAVNQ